MLHEIDIDLAAPRAAAQAADRHRRIWQHRGIARLDDQAVEELQRSDSLHPNMSETLYALGRAAAVLNPNVAEQALMHLVELEKDTSLAGQAYLALAGIHRKEGKTEQAAREMQEYSRIQNVRGP